MFNLYLNLKTSLKLLFEPNDSGFLNKSHSKLNKTNHQVMKNLNYYH